MKVLSHLIRPLQVALLVACFFFPTSSFADAFSFYQEYPAQAGNCRTDQVSGTANILRQNGRAGFMRELGLVYDEATQTFTMNALWERCADNGKINNGFWVVFNGGDNPKGISGELVFLYADASDPNNLILTTYAYNGNNGVNSITNAGNGVADRILSNHPLANDNFVLSSSVTVGTETGLDTIRIQFTLDTEVMNSWIPLVPDPMGVAWSGLFFGPNDLGIWLHPAIASPTYCPATGATGACALVNNDPTTSGYQKSSAGFLRGFSFSGTGWYDKAFLDIRRSPECQVSVKGGVYGPKDGNNNSSNGGGQNVEYCYHLDVGQQIVGAFEFKHDKQVIVDYDTNLPKTALSPESPANLGQSGTIKLDWTPTITDQGQDFFVDMLAKEPWGATDQCEIEICVKPNLPPTCDIQFNTDTPNQCEGEETRVEFTGAGSTDPDGDQLTYTYETNCPNSTLEIDTPPLTGELVLTDPGDGIAVENCEVTLTVDDGLNDPVSCSLPVQVEPCDLDCEDNPLGDKEFDVCGVCDGDGTSCLDCEGIPNGGKEFDICGVCDGDGTSCLDCLDEPFGVAVEDVCGICGGDSTTCLECETIDISEWQFLADALIKGGERTFSQLGLRKLRRAMQKANTLSPKLRKRIRSLIVEARRLQENAWICIWQPESIVLSCNETADDLCAAISNVDSLSCYNVNLEELRALVKDNLKRFVRRNYRKAFIAQGIDPKVAKRRAKKITDNVQKKVEEFLVEGQFNANQIPIETLDCSAII